MGKYDPLSRHLRRKRLAELELSFAEIERLIGEILPHSAEQPQWWANISDSDPRHVQRKAWGDAGYDAVLLVGKDRVRFTRRPMPS